MDACPRTRSKSFSDKNDIYLTGEQLRQELQAAGMIKDRKYHFRTYKNCVVGKDLIDWVIKQRHCDTRQSAIDALRILESLNLIHHVCDDHTIKDEMLFYRFREDDSFKDDKGLTLFLKGQELYTGMASRTNGIIKNYQQGTELFKGSFLGSHFVDFLLREGEAFTREEAVMIGRHLVEGDMIRHVTDDYHFRDDNKILYQFSLDFQKRRVLSDVLNHGRSEPESPDFTPEFNPSENLHRLEIRRASAPTFTAINHKHSSPKFFATDRRSSEPDSPPLNKRTESNSSTDSGLTTDLSLDEVTTPPSVLLRSVTVEELESPDTPYIKQTIKINSDPVGYGFVLRGDSPTYVQAVDPTGPASIAGLKVRQYIYSVNGKYVLQSDHKTVGQLIMNSGPYVKLVIMTHKRNV